ncbi:tetratricopeptide repeat protein, partial [Salmonella enterica]
ARLFEALAEDGNAEAQAWTGALYANGEGVPADLAQAFRWYLRAAESGHVPAQTNVGAMLMMGNGTPTDPERGLHWLRIAAEAGD